jgi:predicted metal-dependent phosphoesterase TrpH
VLKVELHAHTSDDPVDRIPHSTEQLIDRAFRLQYRALAITLHDKQLDIEPYASYAAYRSITLIPGIERTIEGRHVLLLNFSFATESIHTFEELAELKKKEPRGLVVAPHPFYPSGSSLRDLMDRHAALIDAVECNAMFTTMLDFNRHAERWARVHGKPMVGNGDVHRLRQLGSTFTMVHAEPNADAICNAIKKGLVAVHAEPMSVGAAASIMWQLLAWDFRKGRRTQDQGPGTDQAPRTGQEPRTMDQGR